MSMQTHPYLQQRWRRVGRKLAFACRDLHRWAQWRRRTVHTLKQLTGYNTMLLVSPAPRIKDEIDCGAYLRQHIEIQTEPGICMPFFVLIPKKTPPPYPAVIATHGHSGGGKLSVAGCRDNAEVANAIRVYNYDYGVQFVKAGFITFCPDARGFGERQEEAAKSRALGGSCLWLNNMAYPLGQTVTGMWTWDIHRLIDYIQSRTDCISRRIGCAGLSGGGLQTLWAAALDKRIRCAVISGYMYGYKQSLLDNHQNCSCNYVPHLYEYVDMGDIAALIAPRPLLIETGTQDSLNGADGMNNVLSQIRIIRKAYRLLKAPQLIHHTIFKGPHRWYGREAIPWMKQHLVSP